jgi:hypothetical protein
MQSQSATAAVKSQKIAISVVLLTPAENPTIWSSENGAPLQIVDSQVAMALNSWSHASGGKLTFTTSRIISQPLSHLTRCSVADDWKAALKELGLTKAASGQKILVINPLDTCDHAGFAQVGGTFASVRTAASTFIAHELGHTFGFQHSGSVICPDANFSTINRRCTIEQYGDKSDVMGSGLAIEQAKLSLTQSYLTWKSPIPRKAKLGKFTITRSNTTLSGDLYFLQTSNGVAYIELDDGTSNGGFKVTSNDSPGIQIRIVGNSLAKAFSTSKESGISTLLLVRMRGLDAQGNCTALCGIDGRFHAGESVRIPGSPFTLRVDSATTSSAQFTLLKS